MWCAAKSSHFIRGAGYTNFASSVGQRWPASASNPVAQGESAGCPSRLQVRAWRQRHFTGRGGATGRGAGVRRSASPGWSAWGSPQLTALLPLCGLNFARLAGELEHDVVSVTLQQLLELAAR